MKGRESGMPPAEDWESFFDPEAAIERILAAAKVDGDIVDFGCGYGTFTIAAARRTRGLVTALDIEPTMVAGVREKAARLGLRNVRPLVRDFVRDGTGLPDCSQAHAMVFNLLHIEDPLELLAEVRRIVKPRGPPLAIRPSSEQCGDWLRRAGFNAVQPVDVDAACPYHFALVASSPADAPCLAPARRRSAGGCGRGGRGD
jgi:ubiquinone/menaquinone biosynthesis C-methylase UbiE